MDYEELEQRVKELEEQKTKLENEKEELEDKKVEAEEALEEQKKQLDGEKDKDKNFKNLRDKKDKIEADKTDLETKYTELEEEIKTMKKESIDKEKESYLNRYAGDDEDERKKIEDFLKMFAMRNIESSRLARTGTESQINTYMRKLMKPDQVVENNIDEQFEGVDFG